MVTTIPRELLRSMITTSAEHAAVRADLKLRLINAADRIPRVAFGTYYDDLPEGQSCGCPAVVAGIIAKDGEPTESLDDDEFTALGTFMNEFDERAVAHAYANEPQGSYLTWSTWGALEVID